MDKEEIRANLKNLKQSPHGWSKDRQLEVVYWYCRYPKSSRPEELEEDHRFYIAQHLGVSIGNVWGELPNIQRELNISDLRDPPEEVCEVLNEYLTDLPERNYEIKDRNGRVTGVDNGPDFRRLVWPPEEGDSRQQRSATATTAGTQIVGGSSSEPPGRNWLDQAIDDIQSHRRTVLSIAGLILVVLILFAGWITRTPEWLFGETESGTTEEVPQEVPIVVQEDIEPAPNLQETMDAGIALTMEAMPTPTIPPSPTPLPTPDEEATVQAGIEVGIATSLAQTPDPTDMPTATNTPTPTRTPFPTAVPTQEPLVEANFDNGNELDDDPRWNTTGDNYAVSGNELTSSGNLNAVYQADDWTDYAIEFDIVRLTGSARLSFGGGFFVTMRKLPNGNEMYLSMGSSNGCHTEWFEIIGGEEKAIAGSYKDIGDCVGSFRIVVKGDSYTLYRGDEYINDIVNSTFESGGVSFGSDGRRTTFTIDNFAVRPLE